jgi:excisionase family DNA binding protein
VPITLPSRPTDATLSVTKAARLLGVHPNTVRAWSDAGRLRYYRINPRGDRRYRLGDLQRFLAAAETGAPDGVPTVPTGTWGGRGDDPTAVARFRAGTTRGAEPSVRISTRNAIG